MQVQLARIDHHLHRLGWAVADAVEYCCAGGGDGGSGGVPNQASGNVNASECSSSATLARGAGGMDPFISNARQTQPTKQLRLEQLREMGEVLADAHCQWSFPSKHCG